MSDARIMKRTAVDGEHDYVECYGEATDTRPTGPFVNGSWFFDVTNKQIHFWLESASKWDDE